MPALTQRQVYGIFVLLIALAAVSSIDRNVAVYAAVLAAVGVVAVVWAGGGKGSFSLEGFRLAIASARDGERTPAPPGSPPELTALFDALGEVAHTIRSVKEERDRSRNEMEA